VSVPEVPAGRPPVVLVHGLCVSSRYMMPTAVRLAPHYRVYAPDLPGFGRSEAPRGVPGIQGLAAALLAWMDAMDVERPVLVGNSLGCQIAIHLAADHPGRVDRLVLAGPTVDATARTLVRQAGRLALDMFRERPSLLLVQLRDLVAAGPSRVLRTFLRALADPLEARLPEVAAPALVVCGGKDPITPPRWAAEVARLLPRGRLAVLPGAPHAVNYSAPGAFVRLIREWLETAD
jgi:pimeloyl-ACP methyl ester carboxylesterase